MQSFSLATSSTETSLNAGENTLNIIRNARKFIAKLIASASGEQPSVLATIDLSAVISEILKLHMHSQAMSLRAEAEAQQGDFMMRCIRFMIERGTSATTSGILPKSKAQRCQDLIDISGMHNLSMMIWL